VLWFLGMTGPIRGRARHSGGVSDATQKVEPVFFGSKKNSFSASRRNFYRKDCACGRYY
jgi:hypothetical protein